MHASCKNSPAPRAEITRGAPSNWLAAPAADDPHQKQERLFHATEIPAALPADGIREKTLHSRAGSGMLSDRGARCRRGDLHHAVADNGGIPRETARLGAHHADAGAEQGCSRCACET